MGLRPWEVARMTPGQLYAWITAHLPEPGDGRSLATKADDVARVMGWQN